MSGDPDPPLPGPPVHFYLPPEEPAGELAALDPERDWVALQQGVRAWVLQSYLRLAHAGWPVSLGDRPRGAVVVYHAKSWRALERRRRELGDRVLVAVRGDVKPAPNADFEIVQNPRAADQRRRLYLPHWPQPGLLPRDPARGATVRRAAFKGIRGSLHPGLRGAAWRAALQSLGVEWEADEVDYHAGAAARAMLRWPDYRAVDLVVALRPPDRRLHPGKPATKLFNAWLAGVPAVLGPEQAYRAERASELDYLEASSPEEALAAVRRLTTEPELYTAMVANARVRAEAIGPQAVLTRWQRLLACELPRAMASGDFARWRRLPRRLRLLGGRLRRALTPR